MQAAILLWVKLPAGSLEARAQGGVQVPRISCPKGAPSSGAPPASHASTSLHQLGIQGDLTLWVEGLN